MDDLLLIIVTDDHVKRAYRTATETSTAICILLGLLITQNSIEGNNRLSTCMQVKCSELEQEQVPYVPEKLTSNPMIWLAWQQGVACRNVM